ncbi:BTB/POZ domain-containing protein [Nymphaea thermarum]|nr:BTB/POZ domain-containing protein [Nymphaea thermarum]
MPEGICDLQIHVNGLHIFYLNQSTISSFSGKVKNSLISQRKDAPDAATIRELHLDGFPGGPDGFELVSRFCYSDGRICISPINVSLLHCSALFLEMSEEISCCNLLQRTEVFLQGLFYWTWTDILTALRSSEPFISQADSSGLLQKLIDSLLSKICANSDLICSSSSSSSPETPRRSFDVTTKPSFSRAWWFDDLTVLSPYIIEKTTKSMAAYGIDSVTNTKFLIHYLKRALYRQSGSGGGPSLEYGGIAEAVVDGVVQMESRCGFSCRWLLRVLRVVSCFGLSEECRNKIERTIGGLLDQASLDDLLVCTPRGGGGSGIYDVSLVLRLVKVFAGGFGEVSDERMKRVGKLIDKYLMEIAPDSRLKVSKFLAVAECLPSAARDCSDGVYRAIDMYLEAHSGLSSKEQAKLCRALDLGKLSLGACKDLAKNQRFAPRIAIQALSSQQSKVQAQEESDFPASPCSVQFSDRSPALRENVMRASSEEEEFKNKMKNMQWRVVELEKACKEMQSQMSRLMKTKIDSPMHNQYLPKLCSR